MLQARGTQGFFAANIVVYVDQLRGVPILRELFLDWVFRGCLCDLFSGAVMLKKITVAGILAVLLSGNCLAQGTAEQVGVQIRKIEVKKLETPQFSVGSNLSKGKSRQWYGISAEYDTDLQWTDELTFTVYVHVENAKNPKAPKDSLFRAKVTYVNIERGRGHKSDVYLHPSTIARFGEIKRIAVLVEANGKLVAGDTYPKANARWWEQMSPTEGLLLNRSQSPFAMLNFDDYEMVKPTAVGQ